MIKRKHYILVILALLCLLGTGYYAWKLYDAYRKKVAEWNEVAKATFDEALWMEVNKRSSIPIYHASDGVDGMNVLKERIPDSVFVTTVIGRIGYKIDKTKFANSLIKEREKRIMLGILLQKYPLEIDSLFVCWDSLLVRRQVPVQKQVRYIYTDWSLLNDTVWSDLGEMDSYSDSITVRYLGFRCEHELVGYVSCPLWMDSLSVVECIFMLLPWILWGLLFAFYAPLERFVRKKLIREKVVEKEVHVADVPIEKAKIYQLPDGTVFDTFAGTLVRGEVKTFLSPQSVNLLKLFVRTTDFQATAEEIGLHLWNGKGSKEQLRNAISRLRKEMKTVLSTLTIQNEGGIYELKNPHSIEENS